MDKFSKEDIAVLQQCLSHLENEVLNLQSVEMAVRTIEMSVGEFISLDDVEAVQELNKRLEIKRQLDKDWMDSVLKYFRQKVYDNRNRYEEWEKSQSESTSLSSTTSE